MADIDTHSDSPPSRLTHLVVLAIVAVCVVLAGLLFMFARQLGWTLGWIYMGLLAANVIANVACLLIWNPVVLVRRMIPGPGTKTWDWVWSVVFMAIFVAVVVVAMQDLNTRIGDPRPAGITWLIGLAIFVPGWALITWSMAVNPFFEKVVRIQTDHGYHVIDSGPYAHIRHPGYVGFSTVLLSTPLLLASAWTFLPVLAAVAWLVARTLLEDRTLRAELPGYREYAGRVRYRLIPSIW